MALLDQLDRHESDRLWYLLTDAAVQVATEIGNLARCRKSTRDELYGAGILPATVGVLEDIEVVLEIDLSLITARAAVALAESQHTGGM